MNAQQIYLSIVGLLYLGLGIWCSVSPQETSTKVGFQLVGGSGRSEFLTVYGGLEFGIGLLLLLPLVRSTATEPVMIGCILIHGSLVAFRTAGFLMFADIGSMTVKLAVGEWVILLAGLAAWWFRPISN
ncbi:hypothetical protein [Fuerstiella marisgermanici]|uniref:DUF4345 domain-containing protein n=1 Tax=Fuerstiella marisgermanici TaxID=1891926 RepID=A0A1P8WDY8_9PLAN|nr:hypothetical protein [Fuerstiella marisgermanici]APZ92270.1 hypothetical protein Fuma_01880 [Fuerstiella marisgermanici]